MRENVKDNKERFIFLNISDLTYVTNILLFTNVFLFSAIFVFDAMSTDIM